MEEVNKGNIYLTSRSPPSVISAYWNQYKRDFTKFLQCRAEELVAGGVMVLTILGRKNEDHSGKESGYIWELLSNALNHLVSQVRTYVRTHTLITIITTIYQLINSFCLQSQFCLVL